MVWIFLLGIDQVYLYNKISDIFIQENTVLCAKCIDNFSCSYDLFIKKVCTLYLELLFMIIRISIYEKVNVLYLEILLQIVLVSKNSVY